MRREFDWVAIGAGFAFVEGLFLMFWYPGGRDAVALLLQNKEAMADEKNVGANTPWLIDLRRHDERALYGHIKGSMHIRGTNTTTLH